MNKEEPKAKQTKSHATSQNKKVFDVVRPGKVLASPSSRPVIVGHKPQIQDDQFVQPTDEHPTNSTPSESTAPLMSHNDATEVKPLIDSDTAVAELPIEEQKPTEEASAPLALPATASPDEPQKERQPVEEPEPEPEPQPEPQAKEPTPKPSPESLAVSQAVEVDKGQEDRPAEPQPIATKTEPPKTDKLAELVDEEELLESDEFDLGKAIVSHHKGPTSWGKILLLFLLLIVLVVAGLDLLLDAGIVTTGFDVPHTDFVKN